MKTETSKNRDDGCEDSWYVDDNDKASRFAAQLKTPGREERQRLKDLGSAIDWVTEQLKTMKEEDKNIMKKFVGMRAEINKMKNGEVSIPPRRASLDIPRIVEDEEFTEVKKCNMDPFDVDDNVPLRRRALTTMEFTTNSIMLGLDGKPNSRHQTR